MPNARCTYRHKRNLVSVLSVHYMHISAGIFEAYRYIQNVAVPWETMALHTEIPHQACNKGSSISRLCFHSYLTHWTNRAGILPCLYYSQGATMPDSDLQIHNDNSISVCVASASQETFTVPEKRLLTSSSACMPWTSWHCCLPNSPVCKGLVRGLRAFSSVTHS